jgi:hypothetical protein
MQKLAAVIKCDPTPSTSFQRATFLSGMFHKRNLPSNEPLRKYLSSLGWKAIAVTKSTCWKQHKHSLRDMCHNLTVLSIDEERRKKFFDHDKSKMSAV